LRWVENTKTLMRKHSLDAEIIEHEWWGKDSIKVSEALSVPLKNVIKGLVCFYNNNPVLAVICGDDRLDLEKISRVVRVNVRLGRAKELKAIGFQIGGVPAIGSGLKTIVDKKVLERAFIVGSAGSPYIGIKMKPLDLVKMNNAIVDDISYSTQLNACLYIFDYVH